MKAFKACCFNGVMMCTDADILSLRCPDQLTGPMFPSSAASKDAGEIPPRNWYKTMESPPQHPPMERESPVVPIIVARCLDFTSVRPSVHLLAAAVPPPIYHPIVE